MYEFDGKKREPVFEDTDGNEAPSFEVEEEELEDEEIGGEPDEDDEGEDDEKKKKAKKKADDDDEDVVDEDDDKEAELAAAKDEAAQAKGAAAKERYDRVVGEHSQAEYLAKVLDNQIKETRAAITKAKKEDDEDTVAELESKIEDLREAKTKTEKVVEDYTGQINELKRIGADRGVPSGGEAPKAGAALNPKSKAWQKQNPWMMESRAKTNAVLGVASDLEAEGMNPGTDAYFRELSRRVQKEFPSLNVKFSDGKAVVKSRRQPGGSGKKSAVDGGRTTGTNSEAGGKTNKLPRLEPADKLKMRKFGMDPDDKEHVKHWLRSKKEAADTEARRAQE